MAKDPNRVISELHKGKYIPTQTVKSKKTNTHLADPKTTRPLKNSAITMPLLAKQMEEALRRSEEKYRTIIESIQEGYFEIDLAGNYTFVNDAECVILGYSRDELIGMNNRQYTDKEYAKNVFQAFNKLYKTGVPIKELDYEIIRKDGTKRFTDISASLIRNLEGEPIGFRGISRDITERKRIEGQLLNAAQQWRTTFDGISDIVCLLDREGRILKCNKAMTHLLGKPFSEIINRTHLEIVHGAPMPMEESPVERLWKTHHRETDILLINDRWFSIAVDPLLDEAGRLVGAVYIMSDITERKRAEEAIRESEKRYRQVIENAVDIIYTTDANGNFTHANSAALTTTGYSLEELQRFNYLNIILPEHRDRVSKIYISQFRQRQVTTYVEFPFFNKSRDVLWFGQNASLVIEGENPVGFHVIARDITERKRVEQTLQETEERYKALYDRSLDCIFVLDFEGKFIDANQAALALLGYERTDISSLNIASLLDERYLSKGLQDIHEIVQTGFQKEISEYRLKRKDGGAVYVETQGSMIYRYGKPHSIQGIARDITERKQAEETLRQSEEKYRTILETIEEGYFEIDLAGNFIFVNEREASFLGYPKEELIGMNNRQYTDQETSKKLYQAFSRIYTTGEPAKNLDIEVIKKNGTKGFTEIWVYLMRDSAGQPTGFRGIARDITERKQAEEALRRSEERYRNILESIQDGYFEDDLAGNFIFVNDVISRHLGYAKEELIGMNYRQYASEETSKELYRHFSELYQTGHPIKPFAVEYIRRDSSKLTSEISVSLIRDIEGKPIGFRGISRDVTERKQAEEEKLSLQEQLRQAQKMEAVGQLAGGVAHDFNNLLTVIKGYSQLSLLDLKEDNPLWGNIQEIEKATQRATDLTRQLLAFSRRQTLDLKVLDLNVLLKELEKMLRRIIGEDITLATLLSENLGKVKIDPSQIEQVIFNLAVNARDAMPGGGKLTIETANVELDEEYARVHVNVAPGRYVRLSVSDTGVGMTQEVKERVFEPFFTTKEKGKGTGLGLSMVYGIVKQSNGNIWLYSEPERGTTFRIYLPRTEEEADTLHEREETDFSPRGSETVLLVEDDELVRDLANRLLEQQGYRVLKAANGQEALLVAKEHVGETIHLLLADIVMPHMGGKELADWLKISRPNVKILYTSGYADDAIVHHGVLDPGTHFLQKPFSLKTLSHKVREVLDG